MRTSHRAVFCLYTLASIRTSLEMCERFVIRLLTDDVNAMNVMSYFRQFRILGWAEICLCDIESIKACAGNALV